MAMTDRDPNAGELARMVELSRKGMIDGGVGLSSGLYYAPGSYSKTAEVIAMAKATAPYGGVYSSHIRDESDYTIGVVAAVQEVIDIAEQGGVIGVVSHMKALGPASWGLSKTLIENIEAARKRGVQVFADQYPYEASGTGIVGALMPRSAQVGGRDAMMKRITGELRTEIREQVKTNIARRGGADTLMISRYSVESVVRRPAALGAGGEGRRRAGGIRAADAREGRCEPGVVQHVRGRHRRHHAAAVDDDVHRRRPGAAWAKACRIRAPTARSRGS